MRPLVSVIVPAYNYGRFLGETLNSVRAQTLTGWECIVVDDGSTDDTWDVAMRHAREDRRIHYYRRGNGGLAAARNSGLELARGEYVQLLDADDLIERRKLETQVRFLEQRSDVGIVYGDVRYFDSDTGARRRALFSDDDWMPRVSGTGVSVLRQLVLANIMVVNAPLVRRRVVDVVGRFDESLTSLEDWQYWLRCAAAGVSFHFLEAPETLSLVRVHGRSMSQNRVHMHDQQSRIRKALDASVGDDIVHWWNLQRLSDEVGDLGAYLEQQGQRWAAIRCFVEAAWRRPAPGKRMWLTRAKRALVG